MKKKATGIYVLNQQYESSGELTGRSYTFVRDYYSYYPTTLTSTNDTNVSVGLSINSKAYAMLFENTDNRNYEYWLANKYIDIKSTSDVPVINWGIRMVSGKRVTGTTFWDSREGLVNKAGSAANVKPVINISNDTVIEADGIDSKTGLNTYKIRNLG